MDIISYIALALSLFVASPEAHGYFENAPPGNYQMIPLGAVCAPAPMFNDLLADMNPPEQIVETVSVNPNINLHLTIAPTLPSNYTVFAEFINEQLVCAIEIQGSGEDA